MRFDPRIVLGLVLVLVVAWVAGQTSSRHSASGKLLLGFIYCNNSDLAKAQYYVEQFNNDATLSPKSSRKIELKSFKLSELDNPISISLAICNSLMPNGSVYGIIISSTDCLTPRGAAANYKDSDPLFTLTAISSISAYYQIPVVDLTHRNALFSDKSIHSSFIRLTSPYFHQASIWIDLIEALEWKSVNLVHSAENEGKMLASRFQYLADHHEITIIETIEYMPDSDNYTDISLRLARSNSKVFLLHADVHDAKMILAEADKFNLTTAGNVWIVSENAFDLNDRDQLAGRDGFITTQYVETTDLLHFSLGVIKKAYEGMSMIQEPAANCSVNGLEWPDGKKVYESIITNTEPISGQVMEFDEDGDRISTEFNIININNQYFLTVGKFISNSRGSTLQINQSNIIWPGNIRQKPDGTKWSAKFRVVVIEEKPFIFTVPKPKNMKCKQFLNNSEECPWSNGNKSETYCCFGYCIDLIRTLSTQLEFDYELYLVPDGLYGDIDSKHNWNGLMGEIVNERADMILAPFTLNPERAAYVDFTKPFKYQGITILVKRSSTDSSLGSFLQPFKEGLWIMVLLSVHVVAVVLYLLDRFSPFGRFKLSKTENTEEDALNLSRALWFTWGVLLNSGIGEGTPRSFSARVLGMVWAGFAMIMVSSYTANLAAFLVLDRPEAGISGINDARLRNPQEGYSYASVRGSAVERYFKRQVELSTMYRSMENRNFETAEKAIEALRIGQINAFIWDSARLEYEARKSCEFITTGELFGRSSYGIALKKGNPWLRKLSLKILNLHESGYIEDLDKDWILLNNTCQTRDSSPSTLGLTNMAGVFMLVAGGIICGIFLIFVEIAYKNRKDKKVREHDLSRNAFATWRKNVEKRKLRMGRDSLDLNAMHQASLSRKLLMAARQHAGISGEQAGSMNLSKLIVKEENENGEGEVSEASQASQTLLTPRSSTHQLDAGNPLPRSVIRNRDHPQSNDSAAGTPDNATSSSNATDTVTAKPMPAVAQMTRPSKLQTLMLNKNPVGESKMTKLARLAANRDHTST